jgi:hypothetical protein
LAATASIQTIDRTFISFIPKTETKTENTTSAVNMSTKAVLPVSLYIYLNDTSTHQASSSNLKSETPNFNLATCPNVTVKVTSNDSVIFTGFSNFLCYMPIASDTQALVAFTNFLVQATFSNGSYLINIKLKLTPRMISTWAQNAMESSVVVVPLDSLNQTGLSGGEISAIVVGVSFATFVVTLAAVVAIKLLVQIMNPTTSGTMMR